LKGGSAGNQQRDIDRGNNRTKDEAIEHLVLLETAGNKPPPGDAKNKANHWPKPVADFFRICLRRIRIGGAENSNDTYKANYR